MQWLLTLWYRQDRLKWYYFPLAILSELYRTVISIRSLLYRVGIKSVTHFPVPVIVVGNITTGGTGKTPLVIWLCQHLKSQGFNPGIVTRGYKAKSTVWPQVVCESSDAHQVGDEALMLFHKAGCPVVVDPKRVRATKTLLDQFQCDVVISDDGLQHLSLGRNVEIVVIDGERRMGNGYCLPLGPLREPISRLVSVDFIVCQGEPVNDEIKMELEPKDLVCMAAPEKVISNDVLRQLKVHAVAAIGNPQRFFNLLNTLGFSVTPHAFRDHYDFQSEDFDFLKSDEIVIMTEKDAVKCKDFADDRFYYLPVEAKIPEGFIERLRAAL